MSGRKTEKHSHRFYGIFADPWRKLISIGLGTLLWYYLHNHITESHSKNVPLVFNQHTVRLDHVAIHLDSTGYTHKRFLDGDGTRKELTSIKIEFKGSNQLIVELKKSGRMKFVVKLADNDVQTTDPPIIAFRLEDIHHKTRPDEFDKLLSRMTPRTVLVELERNDSTNLLLTPANVELTLEGVIDQGRIQDATFEPRNLDIFGPVEQIQRINNDTKLFKVFISASDIKTMTEVSYQLELTKEFEDSGIELKLPHVIYKVEPERTHFLLTGVPIVLDRAQVSRADGAMYEITPPNTVDVKIGVSGRLYEDLVVYHQAAHDLHIVPASWSLAHARLRLYLRPEDLSEDTITARKPTLELFDVDRNDELKKRYLLDREYVILEQSRLLIEIRKRKK